MDDLKWLVLEAYRQKWLTGEQLKILQKTVGITEEQLREKLKEFGISDNQLEVLSQKRTTKKIQIPLPVEEKEHTQVEILGDSQIPTHAFHVEEYLEDIAGVKQSPGTFLDNRYELKDFLGEGGMGEVYRGYDEKLGRHVALKFLKLGSLDQKQRERFFKEARALGKLNHPHIIQIYDMGEFKVGERSKFYVVMELAEGKTLADQLGGKTMNSRSAAEIAKKVASALVHVHEHHLIHLDIKPSNIMMLGDEPKLMDFGLAKQIGAEASISRVGGTPQYMSPEQCDEGQYSGIGEQTDVYLLGGTLYEMLSGKAPFTGTSEGEILRKVLHEAPNRISVLHKEVHPDLEAI
ncbi:MAG: serine/threonine-protein kinase, partial [Planctomycetota bacterium]